MQRSGRWGVLVTAILALAAARQAAVEGAVVAQGSGPGSAPVARQSGPQGGGGSGDLGEPFEESIEVSVVSLDVVVRDEAGKLVPGLRREDFKLWVDGAPAEISNFSGWQETAAPGGPAPRPDADAEVPPPPAAPAPRLALVLFVDNANMRPFDRNRRLEELRPFLQANLTPDDRIMVVTHQLGMQERHSLTEDPASVGPLFDRLEKESGAVGELLEEERRDTYPSLHHLLRSLGGVAGRKVLIYVGNGLPTGDGLFDPQHSRRGLGPDSSLSSFDQIVADANAGLVTIYALEGSGLTVNATATRARRPDFEQSRQRTLDLQGSLQQLARETGGQAAVNGNTFRYDLAEIGSELRGSYSLGFTPRQAGAGKVHRIRIEVGRPGARVAYRTSYRDRTLQERLADQVDAALLHGQADNPLAVALDLGVATPAGHGQILVPFHLRVPAANLALLPGADGHRGRIDILIGNVDPKGGTAPQQRFPVPLRIADSGAHGHVIYDVKLLLAPGRQRLAFLVHDDLARVSSSVVEDLEVARDGTVKPAAAAAPDAGPAS
jgi:VWFA-related protein